MTTSDRPLPAPPSTATVVDVVARSVLRAGGDVAFGVVGSGNFTVTAAFVEQGGRFVAARHEGGPPAWPMRMRA